MSQVFISHVEEDRDLAFQLADILTAAGVGTWLYERDSLPGPSYLLQTGQAIENARVFAVILSHRALGSHQVGREIIRAYESAKCFFPLLLDVTHVEFQRRQPEWHEVVSSATALSVPRAGIEQVRDRIIAGIRALVQNAPADQTVSIAASCIITPPDPRQSLRLRVKHKSTIIHELLLPNRPLAIGRDPKNDLRLDHSKVSRWHATITHRPPADYLLADSNSHNGTRVNGKPLTAEILLAPGDLAEIGPFLLEFVREPS